MTPPDPNYEDDLFPNDLPLPESLHWESMEEGILTKMDAIQKRKRKRRFIFWLFPLLLLGGLGIGWWSFSATSFDDPQQPLSEVNADDHDDYQSSSANIQEDKTLASESNNDKPNSPQTTSSSLKQKTSTVSTGTSPLVSEQNTASVQPTNTKEITSSNQIVEKNPQPSENQDALTKNSKTDHPLATTEVTATSTEFTNAPVPALAPTVSSSLATATDQIDQLNYQLPLPPAAPITPEIDEKSAKHPATKTDFKPFLRAQLAGGLNWFTGNYKGADENFVMLRQESEYYDPGTQFSVRLERGFAPGVFVGSGFDYKTYRTRLDTEAQSTINRLSSMVLLRFNEDPISGDTTNQEFVDTMLTVQQLRRIRHYNSYTSLEIPLYLGYEFSFGRFNLALTGGLSASISRQMEGRIFDRNGDVVGLGEEAFVSYRNGVSLAAAGGLRFGYRLTDNLSITLGGGYQRFISNWMENNTNALNSRPAVWSTNLGAAWRF